jgi:hypothetical protein
MRADRQIPRHPNERHRFPAKPIPVFGILSKTQDTPEQNRTLKEIIRSWGMNPDQILTKQAMTMPEAAIVSEENQVQELSRALKEMMRKELLNEKRV